MCSSVYVGKDRVVEFVYEIHQNDPYVPGTELYS